MLSPSLHPVFVAPNRVGLLNTNKIKVSGLNQELNIVTILWKFTLIFFKNRKLLFIYHSTDIFYLLKYGILIVYFEKLMLLHLNFQNKIRIKHDMLRKLIFNLNKDLTNIFFKILFPVLQH